MDISKSSNFERYAYDLVGRDATVLKGFWEKLEREGSLDLSGTVYLRQVAETGLVSGSSTHADRIATIRGVWKDYGVMIDPHTADGIKVGLEKREKGCRSSAWRPRSPRNSPRPSARRSGARPRGRGNSQTWRAGRSGSK